MKHFIRRTAVLLAAALIAFSACTGFAEEPKESWPKLDPMPDFGGKDVYFYAFGIQNDYWDRYDASQAHSEEEQDQHDYRLWLQEACNVRIHEAARGDLSTAAGEMIGFAYKGGEEDKLALFTLSADDCSQVLSAGAAAPISCDLSGSQWNPTVTKLMTIGGKVYGVSSSLSAPYWCLYFNKRVLDEAGISSDSIYDMQAKGTWTWSEFEKLLKKVKKSKNTKAGVLTGSTDDLYRLAVYTGGGAFISTGKNGNLSVSVTGKAVRNALKWAQKLWKKYSVSRPKNSSWNWADDVWLEGKAAFYVSAFYKGFSLPGFQGMKDEWGAVVFPKQEADSSYVCPAYGNITFVPSCYDSATADKLVQLYGLWNSLGNLLTEDPASMYTSVEDKRARTETVTLLSDPNLQFYPKTFLLGDTNSMLSTLLWPLGEKGADVKKLTSSSKKTWTKRLDKLVSSIDDRSAKAILPENYSPWQEFSVIIRGDSTTASWTITVKLGKKTVYTDKKAVPGRNTVPASAFAKGGDYKVTCTSYNSAGEKIKSYSKTYKNVTPAQ